MTPEEKARAYDEALAKAKEQYNYPCMRSCMGILEEIFPELKESEDEKIRKALINTVKYYHPNESPYMHGISNESVIAWLEKQGEQKDVEWHREDEQNLNACLGYIQDEFLRRWLKDVVHVKYDKPVWSEEGEGYFDTLIGIMNERMNCSDEGSMVYNVYKKAQDWLKSLKGSVQPKQEWSEEDEEMLNSTILFVEHSAVTTICKEKSNIISWLKSLKERIGE